MSLKDLISKNVRSLRREARMSQASLAKKTGLSVRFISGLENLPVNITAETIERLAKGLGVTPARLVRSNGDALVLPSKAGEDVRKAIELLRRHLEMLEG